MRGFLFCLVLLGAAGFGAYYFEWISFDKTADGKTQISIDNGKIREDTDKAIDKGRNVLDKAKGAINKDNSQGDANDNPSGANGESADGGL